MRGRRWRHGRGQHRGPSVTIQRFLEPCLLLLLQRRDGPRHGYDLAQALEEFGVEDADPSVVYRALRGMEELGLIESQWDAEGSGPARRIYALTPDGHEMLAAWVEEFKATLDMLERFVELYEQGEGTA